MASQTGPLKVLHVGLGPIGAAVVRQVAERKGFRIVGAADIDPAKAGRDLGEVAGVGRTLRVKVSGDVRKAIKAAKPDVVVLCTSSSLKRVLPQMQEIIKLKVPIVSTTEELAYPTKANMKYARAIHQLASKAKVAVLGTGVNPGFVMDALPIALTGVCERVESLRIDRIQDARIRRLPFQQKIGAGLTPRRARGIGFDDCRCDGVEARSDHRRYPAADRNRNCCE
jgi:4-hydroxy-tetrahydrodipicolinate reductase